ncbi:hypothetical protein PR202_ga18890 [Eleusine coracana subsp. coracana]|uniref:BTB domain-containing protein n=1 Tax=Eleusine coracana subsp. coracana TaxID=191504 RepID=A0AAV5CUD8_ELECO|nr:hypothetical protein PR202_ga18890 [Eleusine coracana subsp. coracana]
MSLVHPDTGFPSFGFLPKGVTVFSGAHSVRGCKKFMKISELESSPYLRDDRLVIECDVTVIMKTPVPESETMFDIEVPPSDLSDNLEKLLETQKGTGVTFKAKHENFHAHKIVLAMRSRVFEAQLYGPLGDNEKPCITIEDMEPSIFKTLLHFIYTDSLPVTVMDDLDGDEKEEMLKHLLVAADRYAMERMKLMCESMLCKRLSAESVSTTLALADQYHCIKLKNACIGFINSLNRMDLVMKSQGYEHLKRACPTVFVEIWERAAKSRKI